jgi:hypothetical protein
VRVSPEISLTASQEKKEGRREGGRTRGRRREQGAEEHEEEVRSGKELQERRRTQRKGWARPRNLRKFLCMALGSLSSGGRVPSNILFPPPRAFAHLTPRSQGAFPTADQPLSSSQPVRLLPRLPLLPLLLLLLFPSLLPFLLPPWPSGKGPRTGPAPHSQHTRSLPARPPPLPPFLPPTRQRVARARRGRRTTWRGEGCARRVGPKTGGRPKNSGATQAPSLLLSRKNPPGIS